MLDKYKKIKSLGNITTHFMGKTRGESQHPGIDIANKPGTTIPALNDGIITATGTTQNGMGNIVVLKDKEGNVHQYGHLQNALVKPGMKIKKGKPIAKMGSTGNSYSPTGGDPTHVDIRIATKFGKWKNPMTYLRNFK